MEVGLVGMFCVVSLLVRLVRKFMSRVINVMIDLMSMNLL